MKTALPAEPRKNDPRRGKRGSALITVILMLLVLTVVGVGVAYLTQVEDKITGNDRFLKSAFYAAEAGLRLGEAVIAAEILFPSQLGPNLLQAAGVAGGGTTPDLVLPGGGRAGLVLRLGAGPTEYSPAVSSTCCTVAPVSLTGTGGPPDAQATQARFTLYVRNNEDDPSGQATVDTDAKVQLISVGQVFVGFTTPRPVAITKILEEQITFVKEGTQGPDQKGGFSSGSSGGTVG